MEEQCAMLMLALPWNTSDSLCTELIQQCNRVEEEGEALQNILQNRQLLCGFEVGIFSIFF